MENQQQLKLPYLEENTNVYEHPLVQTINASYQKLEDLIKDEFNQLKANSFKSKPILVNGRLFQLVDKEELARTLGISMDTVIKWSNNGTIPQPFDPEKTKKGRKILKWDLYEVIEWFNKYR